MDLQEKIIEVINLSKSYDGKYAVKNLSFDVFSGEIFGLLGPNGSGKSTTLKISCGELLPTSGSVLVNGYDVMKEQIKVKMCLGVMFESDRGLFWRLTGEENLLRFADLYYMSNGDAKKRAKQLLEIMDLYEHRNEIVGKYSAGMRRKLLLAKALLPDPPIVILDEPFAGLDVISKEKILKLLLELNRNDEKTFLIASHDLSLCQRLVSRVVLLNEGVKIVEGEVSKLIDELGGEYSITIKMSRHNLDIIKKIRDAPSITSFSIINPTQLHVTTIKTVEVLSCIFDGSLQNFVEKIDIKGLDLEDVYLHYIGGERKIARKK